MAEERISLDPVDDNALYPKELADKEATRHKRRRIGVALSGGGIRSATLSLGFFQGLAKYGLVEFVDYLSTVSGGGYFGGFFGHLLHRPPPASEAKIKAAAEAKPPVSKADTLLRDQDSAPFKFLRENGRYLSPNGAGDLLNAGAGILRNWLSVLVVLGLLALFAMTVLTIGRFVLEDLVFGRGMLPVDLPEWLSPLALLVAVLLPVLIVPPGWAYWLVPEKREGDPLTLRAAKWGAPVAGIVLLGLSLFVLTEWRFRSAGVGAGLLSLLVVIRYFIARWSGAKTPQEKRQHMTRGLARGLMFLFVLASIALVDSVGLYIVVIANTGVAGVYAAIVAAVGFFRNRLLGLATRLGANQRTSLPTSVLFAFAAALLLTALLGGIASIPHFVAPNGEYVSLLILAGAAGLGALAVSRVWSFVNRSSMHAVYEARIRRAYLGASNPNRIGEGEDRPAVTDPDPEDGFKWKDYDPSKVGGPIHLVNVTINETVDGYSQVQQRDRKGIGMAIGPDGVSVGRGHHALWGTGETPDLSAQVKDLGQRLLNNYMPFRKHDEKSTQRFRVFPEKKLALPEILDVGQWIAISGGAVSTGLGARTNIALSVLIGFFNVRLGYWWKSGVDPDDRSGRTRRSWPSLAMDLIRRALPVHSALLDEWLARFPGTARKEWNLSDGGHFENMGAYELLRRRLPLIIVCDNEEDSDYAFSGLSNLVRKARTDLGAEITFLDEAQLRSKENALGTALPLSFGTLDSLRRGRRTTERVGDQEQVVVDALETRLSWSHAAVATIKYTTAATGGSKVESSGVLLYVKPTLTGDEPIDVLQYHTEHPAFPQEPTSDQFFDEAQWESYRRLGEHIATDLFSNSELAAWTKQVSSAP